MTGNTTSSTTTTRYCAAGGNLWSRRLVSVPLLAGTLGLLILAATLRPDPNGLGTHTTLGFPPCGIYAATEMPCPTCGMTTSFALAADGRLIDAFLAQPAGALLALLMAVVALVSGYVMITGATLAPLGRMLPRPSVFLIGGAIILVAWFYKILSLRGVI